MKENKSEAIRNHKAEHPNATPSAIVEALKQKKIDVSPAFVSTVLNAQKVKEGHSKSVRVDPNSDIALLMEADNFSSRVGGIDKAEKGLELLRRFRKE